MARKQQQTVLATDDVESFIKSLNLNDHTGYTVLDKANKSSRYHASTCEAVCFLLQTDKLVGLDDILQLCCCFKVAMQVRVSSTIFIEVGYAEQEYVSWQHLNELKDFATIFKEKYLPTITYSKTNTTKSKELYYKVNNVAHELVVLDFPYKIGEAVKMYYEFSEQQEQLTNTNQQVFYHLNHSTTGGLLFIVVALISKHDNIISLELSQDIQQFTAAKYLLPLIEQSTSLKTLFMFVDENQESNSIVKAISNNRSIQQLTIAGFAALVDKILQNQNNVKYSNNSCCINAIELFQLQHFNKLQLSKYYHVKSLYVSLSMNDNAFENLFNSNLLHLTLSILSCEAINEELIPSICNKSNLLSLTIDHTAKELIHKIIEHTTSLIEVNCYVTGKRHTAAYATQLLNAILRNKNITTVGVPYKSALQQLIINYNNNNNDNRTFIINEINELPICQLSITKDETKFEKSINIHNTNPTIRSNFRKIYIKLYHTEIICLLFANQTTIKLPLEMISAILEQLYQPISTTEYVRHQVFNAL